MVERGDSRNKMRKTEQILINRWGTTLYTTTRGSGGIKNRYASGFDIHNSVIKIGGKSQIQMNVVRGYTANVCLYDHLFYYLQCF